jgi:ferrous iron transport protein A
MNSTNTTNSISLIEMMPGKYAYVKVIQGGNSLISRLASMGLTPGVEITMIQNFRKSPVIVSVRYSQIALGRSMAGKIYVVHSG